MRTPSSVLSDLVRSDSATPRVTFYDDAPGQTQGERIELSGKVFANWVAKAANALQEEFDAGPGSVVRVELPGHWRGLYWSFAVWAVGATLDLRDHPGDAHAADVLVTTDPEVPAGGPVVQVTLAALARSAPGVVPAGVMDDARELATYADVFDAWAEPEPADSALVTEAGVTAYADLVPRGDDKHSERLGLSGPLATVVTQALAAWAVDGSVVLVREPDAAKRERRSAEERVTRWA